MRRFLTAVSVVSYFLTVTFSSSASESVQQDSPQGYAQSSGRMPLENTYGVPIVIAQGVSEGCISRRAGGDTRSHFVDYTNGCGVCVEFIPTMRSTGGQEKYGANLSMLQAGTAIARIASGGSQRIFFDWSIGTWHGYANSVRACQ